MNTDALGDWPEHKRQVTGDLKQLKKDVREIRETQGRDTLKISTEIATLRAAANHQARFWGLIAGAVPPLLILLISKLLN